MGTVYLTSPLYLSTPPTYYFGIQDKDGMIARVYFIGDAATTWCKLRVRIFFYYLPFTYIIV